LQVLAASKPGSDRRVVRKSDIGPAAWPVTLRAMKSQHRERILDVPAPASPARFPRDPGDSPRSHRPEVVSYDDDRRTRGMSALAGITGQSGLSVLDELRGIAPDFADWIVDFSYGDVMSRPGLDLRTRQLATIAALTALGNAQPQLRLHIEGALNVGCRAQEIIETILQMAVFAGFPAAINSLTIAREIIDARNPG
jgi:4-carboxymuconolactone decarboxylase